VNLKHTLFVPLLALAGLAAASTVTAVKTGSVSRVSLREAQAKIKDMRLALPQTTSDVEIYKITYPSQDMQGKPATLTGLLMLPQGDAAKGLVLYCHASIFARDFSPSRYTGNNFTSEAGAAMLSFCSGGYAVAMPDYIGWGDDEAVHPYPLSDVNSRSAIDMIEPARQTASNNGIALGNKLFVTGYSEGGAVAMWVTRHLEESGQPPAMTATLSGPYDLTGATGKWMLKHRLSPEGVGSRLFLGGYVAYSAMHNLGINLNDYFSPSMASYIPYVFDQHLSAEVIAKKLTVKGLQLGAIQSIDKVLTPRFRTALETEDTSDPLVAALKHNNCFDWTPHTPILLFYLPNDSIVSPSNTMEALDSMRAHGVGENLVRAFPFTDAHANHETCFPYALAMARRFFDGGFEAMGWPK